MTTDSFDDFLSLMLSEDKGEAGIGRNDVMDADQMGTAQEEVRVEEERQVADLMELLEEETDDFEETEDSEENEEVEVEGPSEVVVTDLDQTSFRLPDGTIVQGSDLQNYNNFLEEKQTFEEERVKYRHLEKLVVENTDIGWNAINSMETQLKRATAYRNLNQQEVLQLQILDSMKAKYQDFSSSLQQAYQQDIQQQQQQQAKQLQDNVSACFEAFPTFQRDLPMVKEYIETKGLDAESLFHEIKYNPKLMGLLMDASAVHRMNKRTTTVAQTGMAKGFQGVSLNANTISLPEGISSYDKNSYLGFAKAMNLE